MEEQRGQCGTGTEKLPRSPGSCQSIVVPLHPERDQCRLRRRRRREERREEKIPRVKGQEKRGFSWLSSTFAKRKNVLKRASKRERGCAVRKEFCILHPWRSSPGRAHLTCLPSSKDNFPSSNPPAIFSLVSHASLYILFFFLFFFYTHFTFHRKKIFAHSPVFHRIVFYQHPCFIFIKFLLRYLNKTTERYETWYISTQSIRTSMVRNK